MERPPVHYAIMRDRRHWHDSLYAEDLLLESDGVLSLPDDTTSGWLETKDALDAGQLSEWLRVKVTAKIPRDTDVELWFFVSGQPTAPADDQWILAQSLDMLIPGTLSENGQQRPLNRYLWLHVNLSRRDTSAQSPRLLQIQAQTPGEDYLDYLPAIYRHSDSPDHFLARWLALFQSQLGDREQLLDMMPQRFDPLMTPDDHLPWLASWLGFELPPKDHAAAWLSKRFPDELGEIDREDVWRELLPRLYTWLYGRRGTPFGLQEFIELYAGVRPHIFEAFHEHALWMMAPDRAVVRCGKCHRAAHSDAEPCGEVDWPGNDTSRVGINTGLAAMSPDGMIVSGFHRPDPRYEGLRGDYYAGEFRVLRFSQVDPQVDFNWTKYVFSDPDVHLPGPSNISETLASGTTADDSLPSEVDSLEPLSLSPGPLGVPQPEPIDPQGIDLAPAPLPTSTPQVKPPTPDEPVFSVRWTGQVRFPHSATVTFYVRFSGGVRLWVGGRLIIDAWEQLDDQERSGRVTMESDRWYPIRLEYFRFASTEKAHITLSWASIGVPRQVIPSTYLYADIDESIVFDTSSADGESSGNDHAFLVGETIVGETGPLEKEDFGMPLFSDVAHLFTVMIPAAVAPTARDRRAILRILEMETPAHTDYELCFVEPMMQVGHQARLGVDSIVARHPTSELQVGQRARLGINSVIGRFDGPKSDNEENQNG